MKITGVSKVECHVVYVEGGEWQVYTRYGPDAWTVRMGESDEPIYSRDEADRLEEMFQAFQNTNR